MAKNFHDYIEEPYNFHPSDKPRGMQDYILKDLTTEQQTELQNFKIQQVRENHKYLKEHPEIKTVINMLFHGVMKAQPKINVAEFMAKYVKDNYDTLYEIIYPKEVEILPDIDQYDEISMTPLGGDISMMSVYSSSLSMINPVIYRQTHILSNTALLEEATIVVKAILNEILDVVCKDDVILQFQKYFGGDPEISICDLSDI